MADALSGRVPENRGTCIRREGLVGGTEEEFLQLVHENIPSWTSVWNALLSENKGVRERSYERENPSNLEKKIQMKISELVDEEETLLNLYTKAAEASKEKEEEFRGKTILLIKQIEKDKNLFKLLQDAN